MFKSLFGQNKLTTYAHALYGTVVARARHPHFYQSMGVPDSFDGRFELLVMHLFMVHYRLKDENNKARGVSQRVFDCFINDMDQALRELGVGDQAVPKRIAKMTRVFYGRTGAYEAALMMQDPHKALAHTIKRNLFPDSDKKNSLEMEYAALLADYLLSQIQDLGHKTADDIVEHNKIFQQPIETYGEING